MEIFLLARKIKATCTPYQRKIAHRIGNGAQDTFLCSSSAGSLPTLVHAQLNHRRLLRAGRIALGQAQSSRLFHPIFPSSIQRLV